MGALTRAVVAAIAGAMWVLPPPAAGADEPPRRLVEVRGLRLGAGQSVGFAFHPSAAPAAIDVSHAGLELCPATTQGMIDLSGGSWPSVSDFDICRETDVSGRVEVPSPMSSSFHVGFALRAADGRAVGRTRITIEYQDVDGFFFFFPPVIEPGAKSARLLQLPPAVSSLAACVYEIPDFRPAPLVAVDLAQRGRRLLAPCDETGGGRAAADLRSDVPVVAQLRNAGEAPVRAVLDLRFR